MATGSLDEFFNQPSVGGGPSWSFKDKPIGTRYMGVVARAVTNADIQQQTIPGSNQPATYRDGRPKFVMRVPMHVEADQTFVDGEASWYVTGQGRDELVRAMAEAGAPVGPPEPGALVVVTLVARRPSRTPGFNPSNQISVRYTRPQGVETAAQPNDAQSPLSGMAGESAASPAQPPVASVTAPATPGDLTLEQQAILARLTGSAA